MTLSPYLKLFHSQWLKCKIRDGERYIQAWAPTMVVCLFLAL